MMAVGDGNEFGSGLVWLGLAKPLLTSLLRITGIFDF
jgi:hypothetical protein